MEKGKVIESGSIAEVLDSSPNAVKVNLSYALKTLRERLAGPRERLAGPRERLAGGNSRD